MINNNQKATLDKIFQEDGTVGIVSYFRNHENLSLEDAEQKAIDLGYMNPIKDEDEDDEDDNQRGLGFLDPALA